MKLYSLLGNSQRLDGGSMFGNVPKALWSTWVEVGQDNLIPLACRALLIEDQGKTILCETGIGAFFPPHLKKRYGVVEEGHILLDSLKAQGLAPEDIEVVILSHLHFDHAGGLLSAWTEQGQSQLLFPNATYLVSQKAWDRACHPHPRDKASFIPELPGLLQASERLWIVSNEDKRCSFLGNTVTFHYSDGHTPGLLLTEVATPEGPLVFAADLIPGMAWVHLPITMGYDRYPELLIDEKAMLLTDLVAREGRLFFTHEPTVAMASVHRDERGRFTATPVMA